MELLSCPFCGSIPRTSQGDYRVACEGISCPIQHEVMSVQEWNTRAISEPTERMIVKGADLLRNFHDPTIPEECYDMARLVYKAMIAAQGEGE